MSQLEVVTDAVMAQLASDGRQIAAGTDPSMGGDLLYTEASMANFLEGVCTRLGGNAPPYVFTYVLAFAGDALAKSVDELIGAIDDKTAG